MVVSHDQLQVRTRKGKKEPEDRQQEIWERAERVYPVRLSLWEKLQLRSWNHSAYFFTVTNKTEKGCFVLRDLVLRVYWDGEEKPSVECPVGDFFCCGFGVDCTVNSLPIVVNPVRGFHCYFQMPFKKHAKITIENQHPADIGGFFYQIDYNLKEVPENAGYFYAQWRREPLTIKAEDYTILDNVSGQGQYIGTYSYDLWYRNGRLFRRCMELCRI